MPIAGDCRTVPFISCACCRAALRLPGLQERAGRCRPGKAQPPPGIEAGEARNTHCRWLPDGSVHLLCPLPGGAALARPTGACRENVGPVRRSRHRALKREALDVHCRWLPNGSVHLLCLLPGGAALARPTSARRENVGPVRRSRHRALKRERRGMPIVGDCRTVPFISCAHYWAALRLPGLHQRAGECRPGKAQPPPGIEAGEALDVHCR